MDHVVLSPEGAVLVTSPGTESSNPHPNRRTTRYTINSVRQGHTVIGVLIVVIVHFKAILLLVLHQVIQGDTLAVLIIVHVTVHYCTVVLQGVVYTNNIHSQRLPIIDYYRLVSVIDYYR